MQVAGSKRRLSAILQEGGSRMSKHVYGRGKFVAHPEYIKYMEEIVAHPNYDGMPNSRSPEGRINWQVSSGKSTSFYKDYLARRDWWIKKADSLNLPGKNDENDRFTVAARLIHPSGYRVCRLCGERSNVGYFYFNHLFSRRLSLLFSPSKFEKGQAIKVLFEVFDAQNYSEEDKGKFLLEFFPERAHSFEVFEYSMQAFERACHIRSRWLSPGFMGNPPDRLDGFHDYDLSCRKANDPGRSDANMRTYNHDRRSFEWWAEGNWALADALYNSAGSGKCSVVGCEEILERVSPDHVGPLASGF
jgi:Alw26I/Eco31I/Esp3I family type II restriction endonuclease